MLSAAQDSGNAQESPALAQSAPALISAAILNAGDLTPFLSDIPAEFRCGFTTYQMTSLIRHIAGVSFGRGQEETLCRIVANFRTRYPLHPMPQKVLISRVNSLYMRVFNQIFF